MENEVVWLVALMSYMMQYCLYTHAYGGMHFGPCNCQQKDLPSFFAYTCAKEGVIPRCESFKNYFRGRLNKGITFLLSVSAYVLGNSM